MNETAASMAATLGYRLLTHVLNFADRYLLVGFSNSMIADLGLTHLEFAILTGFAFTVFYAVFGLFSGAFADRWHRPRLIAFGLFVWSALTAATGAARTFGHAAFARLFIGVGESMLTPAAMSMLSDTPPRHRRSLGSAIFLTAAPGLLAVPAFYGAARLHARIVGSTLG